MKNGFTHYIEMGGGLGDIIQNIYVHGGYRFLEKMPKGDRAKVVLITHNPHAVELFRWHPRAADLEVICPGYWVESEDTEMRMKHHLPLSPNCNYPHRFEPIQFYPSHQDKERIEVVKRHHVPKYLIISASAGLPDRDLPEWAVMRIVEGLRDSIQIVFVGRNYARIDRRERDFVCRPFERIGNALNAIDAFSVPGVAELLRGAVGFAGCHSAVSMLSWYMRKPNLLLYPESVRDGHIAMMDQWAFGTRYKETVHGCFTDPKCPEVVDRFIGQIKELA